MKILELHVEGFRSLKNVTWRPGDLNVVIGPNASGKSNLLKLLEMLSVAADGRLSRYFSNLGGFRTQLWNDVGSDDAIVIELTTSPIKPIDYEIGKIADFSYSIRLVATVPGGYLFASEAFARPDEDIAYFEREDQYYWLATDGVSKSTLTQSEPKSLERRFDEEAFLSRFEANPLSNGGLTTLFCDELVDIAAYQWFDTSPNTKVRRGSALRNEAVIDSDGQNLASVVSVLYNNDRQFKEDMDSAMYAAFGDSYERLAFRTMDGGNIVLSVQWKTLNKPTPAFDLSDGTLRFIYLVAILANPLPRSLIAIDQPETDLHPNMLPIIAEFVVAASKYSQVILTTHSVQLLDAFKVTDTVPTVTVALWEDGETKLTTLEDDELAPWLERYSLGALFNSGTLEAIA